MQPSFSFHSVQTLNGVNDVHSPRLGRTSGLLGLPVHLQPCHIWMQMSSSTLSIQGFVFILSQEHVHVSGFQESAIPVFSQTCSSFVWPQLYFSWKLFNAEELSLTFLKKYHRHIFCVIFHMYYFKLLPTFQEKYKASKKCKSLQLSGLLKCYTCNSVVFIKLLVMV